MRIGLGALVAVTIGCTGGNQYVSKADLTVDTGVVDTGDTGEADTDTDETDTDTGETDTDTDSGDTDTDTGSEICKNDYHPVHVEGWTKTFTATYDGGSGTATEEALPPSSYQGRDVYAYRDYMLVSYTNDFNITEEKGWDNTMFVSCDPEAGMLLMGWDGVSINAGFDISTFQQYDIPVQVDFGSGHLYIPYEFAIGGISTWNNSYTFTKTENDPTNGPQSNTATISSIHNEVGFIPHQLFDGTQVEAYKTVYEMSIDNGLGGVDNNYVEQYWVKGLGMVQEDFLDAQGTVLLSKQLSGYTGLSVIE